MRKKRPQKLAQVTGDRETSGSLNGTGCGADLKEMEVTKMMLDNKSEQK